MLKTSFTKLLGIKSPICCPSMAGASGGALAAEVTRAGAFGFMDGYPEKIEQELSIARKHLQLSESDKLPIGVGFLTWKLDKNGPDALDTALKAGVKAVWFSFGSDIGKWVKYVRSHSAGQDVLIFVVISTVEEARVATFEWKADVIVAQGNEAGGHGLSTASPILTLLSASVAALPSETIIIAAGGLANGKQAAALLVLGASGVVFGTRFLLSPESLYTDLQRQVLIAAGHSSTLRTMAFDLVRGTMEWPTGVDGRAIYNLTVMDLEKGKPLEEVQKSFREAVKAGDKSRMLVWSGTGVGLMTEIKSAAGIVIEIHQDISTAIEQSKSILIA